MKNFIITILITSLLVGFFTGCEDTILNKKPTSSFSEDDIWNDISLTEKFVFTSYNGLGGWYSIGRGFFASATNDAHNIFNSWGWWPMDMGTIDASNMGNFSNVWGDAYDEIRRVNIFFSRIDDVPEADQETINRLKGEMKFIRAKSYADLISLYGGVPIITNVFGLNEDFNKKRDSYQDVVNFIVKELDEAKEMVPQTVSSNNWGKVTKAACLALKSQVLLYAASKLHNPSTEPSGPLFDYDENNKWQQASDAAEAVINLSQFSLVPAETWKDYTNIFLSNNSEIIFARPYSSEFDHPNIDKHHTSNGYHGWSADVPTQNLVNAFEMANGKMIDEQGSGYDPDTPYENRDPRFYANIVYQGANYRGRETEFYLPGGLDSRDGPESWNYAQTGYTMRKFMDESVDFNQNLGSQPYIFFRLAEIYLNYAEAQYHLGNEDVAREYINKIRNRVNMPNISTSGPELLEDIWHERRIELCFERNRFFDVRRWMIADKTGNEDSKGIEWEMVNENKLEYDIITVQERNFDPRMYYIPIPLSEINKTDITQNPGY